MTHKAAILIIQNQSKRFKSSFGVLNLTICRAMFNHDGSLEAVCMWEIQTDRMTD